MKTCFKCNEQKPVSDFYKHPAMKDGVLGKCKECTKADTRENYRARIEAKRKYDRARNQTPERKAWRGKEQKRKRANHPEKYKARQAVENAVRAGRITKQACGQCGSQPAEAHHYDYSRPLEVTWLCFVCHRKEHGQLKHMERVS